MSTRDKNDISYFKFMEATKDLNEDSDPIDMIQAVYNVFRPKNVNRFIAALEREGKLRRCFRLDLDFKVAGRFIDADTSRTNGDVLSMFKFLLVPKRMFWKPWSFHKVEDISLREAEHVLSQWNEFLSDIKLRYEYIYNPPVRFNDTPETQGSIERQAFAEHYGGYANMTYLIATVTSRDFKSVFNDDLEYFLFWGEFLLRQKDVEKLK